MKLSLLQMDMILGQPEENFRHAEAMLREAMEARPDVLVLPETWNTGFFPKEDLASLCDKDAAMVQKTLGALAARYRVNIVAGSVSNLRDGKVCNTACVFDRSGTCIAQYDKTHLFTPMNEHRYYTPGNHLCRFSLDGLPCGLIICYDVRFPELTRKLALDGAELVFMVSQWPLVRKNHLRTLTAARAIENQLFFACCNSCGTAGETVYGGNSSVIDPWGNTLASGGEHEEILTVEIDPAEVHTIRNNINVFRDRRPSLYK